MKNTIRDKTLYIGAGAGLVAFALYGLLPSSWMGGIIGLNMAGSLLGSPVNAGLLARALVTVSMVAGVLVSGLVFTLGGSTLGWLAGAAADSLIESLQHGPTSAGGSR